MWVYDVMILQNSHELFIQLNREALESEYVSNHTHKWIDLIFGTSNEAVQLLKVCMIGLMKYTLSTLYHEP